MAETDVYRRLDDRDAGHMLGDACGTGMLCITYISNAYQIIYDLLYDDNVGLLRNEVNDAFDYICTAFELQNDMVTDWSSGRDIFDSILKLGRSGHFYNTSRRYILTQILLQIETFGYGHVSRSTLAYIIDLFALYFMLDLDYTTYISTNLDFPKEWKTHSRVVHICDNASEVFHILEDDQN